MSEKPSHNKVGFFDLTANFIFEIEFLNLTSFKLFHHEIFKLFTSIISYHRNISISPGR